MEKLIRIVLFIVLLVFLPFVESMLVQVILPTPSEAQYRTMATTTMSTTAVATPNTASTSTAMAAKPAMMMTEINKQRYKMALTQNDRQTYFADVLFAFVMLVLGFLLKRNHVLGSALVLGSFFVMMRAAIPAPEAISDQTNLLCSAVFLLIAIAMSFSLSKKKD